MLRVTGATLPVSELVIKPPPVFVAPLTFPGEFYSIGQVIA